MAEIAALEAQFADLIARELECRPWQVESADALLRDGGTVPFIARYRKEATGALDDAQLEVLDKRRTYFLKLAARRATVLASIAEQDRLTPELEAQILSVTTKQQLEDLYLPYRPRRRSRAQEARDQGLEPLADALLTAAPSSRPPELVARRFVAADRGVRDAAAALKGARDILAERFAETAEHRAHLRKAFERDAVVKAAVVAGKEDEAAEYRDYFDHAEAARTMPSHRVLAVLRGEKEGVLKVSLEIDDALEVKTLATAIGVPLNTPSGAVVAAAVADSYVRLLRPSIASELMTRLRDSAEAEAISVFRANLEALLMQPPLGETVVMGIDPGHRTGCKVVVVDATGRVLAHETIRPLKPKADPEAAAAAVTRLVREHGVRAIAVGNGTGGRETELFVRSAIADLGEDQLLVTIVPETGASVYSASKVARQELPDLDVAERGSASIARRLQDPLAELVKIEPRSLGVGQYQHDVNQKRLGSELRLAVEKVVHRVGVEVNTASAELLRYVSGLGDTLARSVVAHRDDHGPLRSRQALLEVPGIGPKTFEVAAGFLRVRASDDPLDATAVHPERYDVVHAMAASLGSDVPALLGNPGALRSVDLASFTDDKAGLGRFTLADIKAELARPGRDPRPSFKAPRWSREVLTADDLREGMTLEGRVSNVTNFGAFVDIGIKRNGLVHLSELSKRRFADPRDVVRVGEVVTVKVIGVDQDRGRISLSMKAVQEATAPKRRRGPKGRQGARGGRKPSGPPRRPQRKPEPRHATIDDLIGKFGGRKMK
jgi:uncharacterized protein